ncbi:MAG: sulfatase [bacterium]|nr:sulfatase [bacterium]
MTETARRLAPLVAAALAAGCGRPVPPATPTPTGRNVVLITIDTLRADHLSGYGYHRKTSPFLDSLAARGTLFNNAWATSSWTPPSMASIFTGLSPRSHGVIHGQMDAARRRVMEQQMLVADFPVIAAHLAENGYTAFGISTNLHMTEANGFDRGFRRFANLGFSRAPAANRAFEEMLPEIRRSRPYFLWIHYFDPHDPYFPCRPWITAYNPDKTSYRKYSHRTMKKLREMLDEIRSDPAAPQALRDLYDSEINYTDDHIRALVEALPDSDNTLFIVTSDHGEEFLERGELGHGSSLFEEQVRVPLIIAPAGGAPAARTVEQPVSIMDIFPSICEAAGVAPPAGLQGRSLLPLTAGGPEDMDRAVFAELSRARAARQQEAIRRGDWKFVRRGGGGERRALYNLARDPGEQRNLIGEEPERARSLEGELERWLEAHRLFEAPPADEPLGEKEIKELRSLGYLN